MKAIKILLIAAGLLGSIQTMACSVHINVKNESGETLDEVSVWGPWGRHSDSHKLTNGEDFTYHATGSTFSCHGGYGIDNTWPHCDITGVSDGKADFSGGDGKAYFVILKEKNGSKCMVSKRTE